jgi:hypothetical protein
MGLNQMVVELGRGANGNRDNNSSRKMEREQRGREGIFDGLCEGVGPEMACSKARDPSDMGGQTGKKSGDQRRK